MNIVARCNYFKYFHFLYAETYLNIIDISQTLSADMPVYPGTEQPTFIVSCTIAEHGFTEKKMTLYSHTGTHIDAPGHLLEGAKTLDQLPIQHFYGRAVCLDYRLLNKPIIDVADLSAYQSKITGCDFVLLQTGWSRFWNNPAYFNDYPVPTLAAAEWLAQFNLKGVGVDTISVDEATTDTFLVHKTFFRREMIVIENLTRLDVLPEDSFFFSAFPLKILQADGSPVRAVGLIP